MKQNSSKNKKDDENDDLRKKMQIEEIKKGLDMKKKKKMKMKEEEKRILQKAEIKFFSYDTKGKSISFTKEEILPNIFQNCKYLSSGINAKLLLNEDTDYKSSFSSTKKIVAKKNKLSKILLTKGVTEKKPTLCKSIFEAINPSNGVTVFETGKKPKGNSFPNTQNSGGINKTYFNMLLSEKTTPLYKDLTYLPEKLAFSNYTGEYKPGFRNISFLPRAKVQLKKHIIQNISAISGDGNTNLSMPVGSANGNNSKIKLIFKVKRSKSLTQLKKMSRLRDIIQFNHQIKKLPPPPIGKSLGHGII